METLTEIGWLTERQALLAGVTIIQLITFGAGYTLGRFTKIYKEQIKKLKPIDDNTN